MDALPASLPTPMWGRRAADFLALLKPRPMSVVVSTAIAGLLAAPTWPAWSTMMIALTCIAAGGGGSAVLNMWFERDIDARMTRTVNRPLPAGRVTPNEALLFGLGLSLGSVLVMGAAVGVVAGIMLAATVAAYGVLYTMLLKRRSVLNVVVGGGAASLLTALTGWASATGAVGWEGLALFAFLVPWTAPHVWSQAMSRVDDYRRSGVPMLPAVVGLRWTSGAILVFTAAHVALALLPVWLGWAGALWAGTNLALGGLLLIEAFGLVAAKDEALARRRAWIFYRHSIGYVVAMLIVIVAERALGLVLSVPTLGV